MSGFVSGINYGLLFGTSGSTTNIAASMLATLYSGGTGATASGTAVSTGNPLVDLKLAEQNESKDVAREAKDPAVVRDLAAFQKAVAGAKDIGTALQNPAVLKVLLTANGLADQAAYPALASKALLSNPADPNSLVNKLSDSRWKTVAQNLNLANGGLKALQSPAMQRQLADAYARVSWLNSLDQATPGLSSAIEFKQQASQITSVDQILGDPVNRDVVLTALGIPQQIAFQDLTAQEQAVSSRLDVTKLRDPTFVTTLTDQYLLAKKTAAQGSAGASMTALAVRAAGISV